MGRATRPNVRGGIFHLTARTLRHQRWFTPPVRTQALDVVGRAVPASDIRLLAVAIMPNHLHLVVQQGRYPVGRFMQSILRRLVHLIHREHDLEGPIFWRPYGYTPCQTPEHARNAIVYTNLNPVRARLCADPASYPWSSHDLYLREPNLVTPVGLRVMDRLAEVLDARHALPLFAAASDRSVADLRGDYQRYVAWRMALDRWKGGDSSQPPAPPGAASPRAWSELEWSRALSPLFHTRAAPSRYGQRPAGCPDLADIARATVAAESPGLHYHAIRGRRGGRKLSRLRHLVIWRAHNAGYRNADIARFLDLSESAVSKVVCTVSAT